MCTPFACLPSCAPPSLVSLHVYPVAFGHHPMPLLFRAQCLHLLFLAGEPPSGRVGHTINAIGTRLFVLGGRDYATNRFDSFLHVFETVAQRWSKVNLHSSSADMKAPILRTGHCTDAHEGSLLLFGGLCADGTYRDDVSLINLIDHS
eukprot:6197941-Pleurochrysis_carterae.AAC.3